MFSGSEKVAHMAAGREKKLICGQEEEVVVAHDRLPSPARCRGGLDIGMVDRDGWGPGGYIEGDGEWSEQGVVVESVGGEMRFHN